MIEFYRERGGTSKEEPVWWDEDNYIAIIYIRECLHFNEDRIMHSRARNQYIFSYLNNPVAALFAQKDVYRVVRMRDTINILGYVERVICSIYIYFIIQ